MPRIPRIPRSGVWLSPRRFLSTSICAWCGRLHTAHSLSVHRCGRERRNWQAALNFFLSCIVAQMVRTILAALGRCFPRAAWQDRHRSIADPAAVPKAQQEIAEFRRFLEPSHELVEVSEQVCRLRPVEETLTPEEKKTADAIRQEITREVDQLLCVAARRAVSIWILSRWRCVRPWMTRALPRCTNSRSLPHHPQRSGASHGLAAIRLATGNCVPSQR